MTREPRIETVAGAVPLDELADLDRRLIIHPHLPASTEERVVMVEGKGCRVSDSTGRSYLDATGGGLWLGQVGHGNLEIAEAARVQYERLEYFTSFWEYSNDKAIELAARLVGRCPKTLARVFFTSGGSEGIEAALKMARYAHARSGRGERTWILSRQNGYHGAAMASGTATGFGLFHEGFGPLLPHVRHLTPPWPYRTELYEGRNTTDFLIDELESTIDELGADSIAAFIGEPVMGVAGILVPPDDYWPRVSEILRAHGIHLIIDEVVTGFGRSGAWFGSELFNLEPDIVVSAKGITSGYAPLGAVLISDEIAEALTAGDGFPMGYTYTGHPLCCAVALANLQIIERDGLIERARETGAYLLGRLRELEALPVVGEARGIGMMLALELVRDKETREPLLVPGLAGTIRRETGVIVRENAHHIVLAPPLVMTIAEADEAVDAVTSVLERLEPDGTLLP